jgi:isopentenyldiphosphate isomerase
VLQPTEVEQVKWVDKDEFFEDVRNNPDKYLPTMSLIIDALYPAEEQTFDQSAYV